jgi:hypothetical protein
MTSIDRGPRSRWLLPTLVGLILFSSVVPCACWGDPAYDVDIENKAGEAVVVFQDGAQRDMLNPGGSVSYTFMIFGGTKTFTVKTLDGRTLTSRTFTWEEIRKKGGIKIVVEE